MLHLCGVSGTAEADQVTLSDEELWTELLLLASTCRAEMRGLSTEQWSSPDSYPHSWK